MTKNEFLKALEAMNTTPRKIAGEIGVSPRQAYRYASGESGISPAMAILIKMLVKAYSQHPGD